MKYFFSPNSDEDQKKGLHQKWSTFFPRIQEDTNAQMHTRVKQLGRGMQMYTILKLLGGYSQTIGGIYPPSLRGFGTPAYNVT